TAYWSIGIRRNRLVRSTAKIKIPPAQRPQETSIIQAMICVIVMRYAFISRWCMKEIVAMVHWHPHAPGDLRVNPGAAHGLCLRAEHARRGDRPWAQGPAAMPSGFLSPSESKRPFLAARRLANARAFRMSTVTS